MRKVHFDVETFSAEQISYGSSAYAMHESTKLLVGCFAIDDEAVERYVPGDEIPEWAYEDDVIVYAHNALFEYVIWLHVLCKQNDWPQPPPLKRWRCTAAMAAACALPRALGNACKAVGLPEEFQKDKAGDALIKLLCIPKNGVQIEDPIAFESLCSYCEQDVVAERALSHKLPSLIPSEQELWEFDCAVNMRGIPVDRDNVFAAMDIMEMCSEDATNDAFKLTNGRLLNIGSNKQLIEYCKEEFDYTLENCQKAYLQQVLDAKDAPSLMKKLLRVRLDNSKASVKKYPALEKRSRHDGRARDTMLFLGAQPGRWTGRGFQPHNLMRPEIKDTDAAIEHFVHRDPELLRTLFGEPMSVLGSCVRAAIKAKPGFRFVSSDFSAVESRALAWLAGQKDKLDIFRTTGKVYEYQAAKIYHLHSADSVTKDDPRRQIGKVSDLSMGYQGGYRAFIAMGASYGIDPDSVAEEATDEQREQFPDIKEKWYRIDYNVGFEAELEPEEKAFAQIRMSDGEAFADLIKLEWRASNDKIVQCWNDVLEAALLAADNPGKVFKCCGGKLHFKYFEKTSFLFCRLPSGRRLSYSKPRSAKGKFEGSKVLHFTGTNDVGNWARQTTWGGKLVQNIIEGICRDLLAHGMLNVERAGYPIIFHVHDECTAEVPEDFGNLEEFNELLCDKPKWAEDFPLVADGWEGYRYRK